MPDAMCAPLDALEISRLLPACCADVETLVFKELDSTNDEALRRIASGLTRPALLAAESQRAGRGRMGRSFYSPAGTGLYMSMVLAPRPAADCLMLTTAAAVACHRAIYELSGIVTGIKWVNDLYYQDKKVCGILAEAHPCGSLLSAVVGVGVNLGTTQFPGELAGTAGSLPSGIPRNELAAGVAGRLFAIAAHPDERSYMEDYRRHSIVLGRRIRYLQNGVPADGLALSIDDAGALSVLRSDGKTVRLDSGEISLTLK